MRELGGSLHLALEAGQHARVAGFFGANDLYRAGALHKLVLGQVDLAHAAGAQEPLEPVLAQLAGLIGLATQPADRVHPHRRAQGGDRHDERCFDGK